jgi:transcription initiation factor IIF auxiliary subunit
VVANELDVQIKDTVFDPDAADQVQKVMIRKRGQTTYYKVFLFLEGEDVALVESVTYILHKTFANPIRTVSRRPSNPNCQLVIWTWGMFTVRGKIVDKRGRTFEISHPLTYEKQLPASEDQYEHDTKAMLA